jgi:hypothetical protein
MIMKMKKKEMVERVVFGNGRVVSLFDFEYDGVVVGFMEGVEEEGYSVEVLVGDGYEGWSVYLDENGEEVDYEE